MKCVPEAVLRRIWETRITSTTPLTTTDGLPVSVVHRGTPNNDGGPDFLNALVRIGTRSFRGDVELHRSPEEWYTHGHDSDPHYNRVVLHVVARCPDSAVVVRTASRRALPLLVLDQLDPAPSVPEPGDPAQTLFSSIASRLNNSQTPRILLRRKGWIRILKRVRRLEHRVLQLLEEEHRILSEPSRLYDGNPDDVPVPHHARHPSEFTVPWVWEQVLYESIMEACGYSRNSDAFLALARNVPLVTLRTLGLKDTESVMAILFGAAGLLPAPDTLRKRESRRYVRRLRRKWNRIRPEIRVPMLHETDWLFFRLRPANFPTARLAVIASLLPDLILPGGFDRIRCIVIETKGSSRKGLKLLRGLFRSKPDGYWRHHLHFTGETSPVGASLGRGRIDTILLNSVLPLLWLYARLGGDTLLGRQSRDLIGIIPSSHETRMVERVRRLMLPQGGRRLSAIEEQGVIRLGEEEKKSR